MDVLEKIIPKVGDKIGRYELIGELGRGGFGIVYHARQMGLEDDVAIKLMIPQLTPQATKMQPYERFELEAKLIRQLEHPCTIKIRDFGRTEHGLPYLGMEYVRGKSLDAVLHEEGPFTIGRTIKITKQVLGSLAEAHYLEIVHRDLKPANIMLGNVFGEKDITKVLDFGIAKVLGGQTAVHTIAGTRFGTPWYMAPEQAKGEKIVDARLDLYALGLIIAECLTARKVVQEEDFMAALMVHAAEAPLSFEDPVLDSPLFSVIKKATSKSADDRYPSALAMRKAIEDIQVSLDKETLDSLAKDLTPSTPSLQTSSEMDSVSSDDESKGVTAQVPLWAFVVAVALALVMTIVALVT